jgi:N-glycosylase/DNA lyase
MKPAPEPPDFSLDGRGLDLDATLASGQSFSWRRGQDGGWRGWIGNRPCLARSENGALHLRGPGLTEENAARYFGLDSPLAEIFASFPDDPWLARARAFAPGLRLLRQEPWETLCNFICSSLKQIVQIEQINHDLRRAFGPRLAGKFHAFPEPARLAQASEADLRACRLGFRARHLFVAARQIAAGEISLERIASLPTAGAREELRRVRGVGEKVANCILLFAYGRLEAFPIDVWVERVLRRLYFRNRRKIAPGALPLFAGRHFGPYGGYAQQFLFHWIRKDPTAMAAIEGEEIARKKSAVSKRKA